MKPDDNSPTEYPIDGSLDLHLFAPADVKEVVLEYIEACRKKKISRIRIIHGKGIGTLRTIVHKLLENHPAVAGFRHEGGSGGGWGATVVDLKE